MDKRAKWTRRKLVAPLQLPSTRKGTCAHYPGWGTKSITFRGKSHNYCLEMTGRLEDIHVNNKKAGYKALAYNLVVCVHGKIIEGRGKNRRSAANGNAALNKKYGAILFLIGDAEKPTDKQYRAFNDATIILSPKNATVVNHGDIRPGGTSCPGPYVRDWVRKGSKSPQTKKSERRWTQFKWTVKKGDKGADVIRVRKIFGMSTKHIWFTDAVVTKVRRYQMAHGLKVTGRFDPATARMTGRKMRSKKNQK